MTDNTTVQDEGVSTALSSDEGNTVNVKPDEFFESAFLNATDGLRDDVEAEVPSEVEETQEDLEVSEDTEQTPSDDDSNIDDDVDEEETDGSGEEYEVVDYDELKKFKLEFGGEHYSAGDIKAALGQIKKQEEARIEVEAAREEVENQKKELDAYRNNIMASQAASAGVQQMASLEAQYNALQEKRKEALDNNNGQDVSILSAKMDDIAAQHEKVKHDTQMAQNHQASEAAKALDKFGFGALNTDTQRQKAFYEYAHSNIPPGLIGVVDTHPELLVLVEKARLHDKANTDVSKGKLKSAKVTMKGGAAKVSKPKTKDPLEAAFFNATQDLDFRQ